MLLDTCGEYFDYGSSKKKLDNFLVFFQVSTDWNVCGLDGIVPCGELCILTYCVSLTLCEAARHCLVYWCPGSTSDPL